MTTIHLKARRKGIDLRNVVGEPQGELIRDIQREERRRFRRLVRKEIEALQSADPNKYTATEAEQAFFRLMEGVQSRTKSVRKPKRKKVNGNARQQA